jgi:nucleoside-diphosphate-sugar epimerase
LEQGLSGQVYNVGSGEVIDLGNLAKLVGSILAPDKPVVIKGRPNGSDRNIYVPDIHKASEMLGLQPTYSLSQAIEATGNVLRYRVSKNEA